MASKNKGGKNVKTTAARDLKQKRADKRSKKEPGKGLTGHSG